MNPFKKIKFLALAAAIICPTFTACNDDDEVIDNDDEVIETDATSAATYVAGTFTGDCKTVVYTATIDETQEFTITMQEDGTFTLITPAITYAQMGTTIPSFTVSGMKAELTTLNDVTIYQLSASDYTGEVVVNEETKTYTVSQLSIAISKADSTAAINYTFNYGKIPFPVEVSFAGSKKCYNDDDDDVIDNADATSAATYVAGTFTGDCKTVVYTATIDETQEFTITMQEDSTFTLTTPSITYSQMGTTIPSFTVSGMKAEQTTINDVTIYQLSATDYAGEVVVNEETKSYTVSQLSIAISKADSSAAINYTFKYGKIPFDVVVSFNGKKK